MAQTYLKNQSLRRRKISIVEKPVLFPSHTLM